MAGAKNDKGGDGVKGGAAAAADGKKADEKTKEPEIKKTPQQLSHEGKSRLACIVLKEECE